MPFTPLAYIKPFNFIHLTLGRSSYLSPRHFHLHGFLLFPSVYNLAEDHFMERSQRLPDIQGRPPRLYPPSTLKVVAP